MRLGALPVGTEWSMPTRPEEDDARYRCADGMMTLLDLGRAAGISAKEARRQVEAYYGADIRPAGAVFSLDADTVPDPTKVTRAAMARLIAERLGLGRCGARRRARETAAAAPSRERKSMTSHTHPWKRGTRGRAIRTVEGGHQVATLSCRCGETHDIRFRELAGAEQIDRKFTQAGWRLDPSRCPACANPKKETTLSAATPSPAAIRSQAAMFRLLGEHFDVDAGRYAPEWSDDRIAKETSLSAQTVAAFREEAFGPIREPEEVAALARDIATFDGMLVEAAGTVETLKSELAGMKTRLAEVRRKFAA